MTGKNIGVITVAIAATPVLGLPAVAAAATPVASSYAELLEPIPNATERLRASDREAAQRPAQLIKAQWGYGGSEHHHHHHHHHHHNNYYAPPVYGYGYEPSYGYSTYYVQPEGYSVYYARSYRRSRAHRREERREHHHYYRRY
jgi:hypothetical protein